MIAVKAYSPESLAEEVVKKRGILELHGDVLAIKKSSIVTHQGSKTVYEYEYIQFLRSPKR